MKNLILSIIFLCFTAVFTQAQTAEEMKAWQEYMTPSEMHKVLSRYDGKWNAHITMWMAPEQPPMQSKGTCENEMIMDGRYQNSTFKADMMGMPFEGKSITAFDNATKMFKSIWIDNMGTGMMFMEGPMNEESKSIEMKGTMVDPMSGKSIEVRQVLKLVNENEQFFEMFMNYEGKEFKSMEISYMRVDEKVVK